VLARHTLPELDEHDLSHLDRYTAAARLVVDGAETAAFTLRTNPPPEPIGKAAEIRARCAERTREQLSPTQPANAQRAGLPADDSPRRRGPSPTATRRAGRAQPPPGDHPQAHLQGHRQPHP
jgi:hypothetical protein